MLTLRNALGKRQTKAFLLPNSRSSMGALTERVYFNLLK